MASPQEVLEIAIPHPADVTPELRRSVAQEVIAALEVNEYYFVRRQVPVLDQDDGQCPKCKCELVHVEKRPTFLHADERIQAQQRRIAKLESALRDIAMGHNPDPRSAAQAALY